MFDDLTMKYSASDGFEFFVVDQNAGKSRSTSTSWLIRHAVSMTRSSSSRGKPSPTSPATSTSVSLRLGCVLPQFIMNIQTPSILNARSLALIHFKF